MQIELARLEQGARKAKGVAVIIDVFRAFTTAAHAFANGAQTILMVDDATAAFDLRASGMADYFIGEADGRKIEGFDFGNSPHDISQADLRGKTLAQRTSNGTRGITAATGAEVIYTGAFVTAAATVRRIQALSPEFVTIVAMGAAERPMAEDEVCALYHYALLQGHGPNRAAVKDLVTSSVAPPPADLVASGDYPSQDWDLALAADVFDFAISVARDGGLLVARPER